MTRELAASDSQPHRLIAEPMTERVALPSQLDMSCPVVLIAPSRAGDTAIRREPASHASLFKPGIRRAAPLASRRRSVACRRRVLVGERRIVGIELEGMRPAELADEGGVGDQA